jgi:hypothetical protein
MIVLYISSIVTVIVALFVVYLMIIYPPESFIGWLCYTFGTVLVAASIVHLGINSVRLGMAAL